MSPVGKHKISYGSRVVVEGFCCTFDDFAEDTGGHSFSCVLKSGAKRNLVVESWKVDGG